MTDIIDPPTERQRERGFNRRSFLAGTGVLIVAASLPRLLNPKQAFGAGVDGPIGPALVDATQVDSWLAIHPDNTVTVYTGKVELGTGVLTTTTQLVADELRIGIDRITVVEGDTWKCPDQGYTAGSQSNLTQYSDTGALRQAGATARVALLNMASTRLGVPVSGLTMDNGTISGGGGSVTYGELIGDQKLNLKLGNAKVLEFGDYHVVGTSVPRVELPAKIYAQFEYTQDVKLPGMVHARVVRPPTLDSHLRKVIGWPHHRKPEGLVGVFARGDAVAVVCETEWQAINAAQDLQLDWELTPLPPMEAQYDALRAAAPDKATNRVLIDTFDVDASLASAAKTLSATYKYPIQQHGSMGPSCAVADVQGSTATVYSSTQGVYNLRGAIATALGVPNQNVHVVYVEGSGCYGINGADNVSLDAALISNQIGKPVRVQYMRADEMGWENYGQAYLIDMKGGLDANGNVAVWDYEAFTASRGGRPGPPANIPTGIMAGFPETALAASPPPTPTQKPNTVDGSNSGPSYVIPSQRLRSHTSRSRFLAGPLRSPSRIQNTFANECFMDELAHAAGQDPVAYRVKHLKDQRLIDCVTTAAQMADWKPKVAASQIQPGRFKTGRGIAAMLYEGDNGYNAAVFQVTVDTQTGKVKVDGCWTAQDCGPVINPDGMRAQAEGCLMQTISRSLIEELKWKSDGITSLDWESYPVIRFNQMPETFEFTAINRPEAKVMGAGEVLITNGPAAIGNAIFDATGVRLRQLPFTPVRVREGLAAAASGR
jgi:CO/xanthine dehydrogenase Mo-binding subunit